MTLKKMGFNSWLAVSAVALGFVTTVATTDAGRRQSSGSSGSSGSYGSSGSSGGSYYSSYGSSGSSGSYGSSGSSGSNGSWGSSSGSSGSSGSRGNRASRRGGRSSGSSGSSGSYGSSGYQAYNYGSHGSSYGSHGTSGGSYYYTPAENYAPVEEAPQNQPAEKEEAPVPTSSLNHQKARITVQVPTDAKVLLNGTEMTSAGETRKFISPVLPGPGPYYYHIQVEVIRNGEKQLAECQQIIEQGRSYDVAFAEKAGSLVFVEADASAEVASR